MDAFGPLIDAAPRTFFGVPSLHDLGALQSPAAARAATEAQFYYSRPVDGADRGAEGWYDVEADREYLAGVTMVDVGDVVIQGSDTEGNYARITRAAQAIAEHGSLMVAIGGDH